MKLFNARRPAALAAAAIAAATLVASPVQAETGNIDYSCKITDQYSFTFTFNQDTNLPPKAYVAKPYNSTYKAITSLPENGVNVARFFGVTRFDGAIDATVLINGVAREVHAPIPSTPVPPSGGIVLTATGPLGALGKSSVGSIVLKPSAIKFTVNAYKADDSKLFGVDKAPCTMTPNTKVMDTVTFIRSATTTTSSLGYTKATKKVTSVSTVKSASGVAPTGSITADLYKGSTKVKSAVLTLVGGKATAVFTGVKAKGAYKVVTTYRGSAALNRSAATRTFTIR